jgi:hypothetical protein
MGREVYHGDPNGDSNEKKSYDNGVREGAFGLILNSVRTSYRFVGYNLYMTVPRGNWLSNISVLCTSRILWFMLYV